MSTLERGSEPAARMPSFRSLLYSQPQLYDLVFPDKDDAVGKMVRTAIGQYLPGTPRSMLDVGCGTGRLLETLARTIPERWGVDLLESNITYARSVRTGVTFQVGDMRTVRLARTFDLVTCLGNALSYALSDDDLIDTVSTFAAHAHGGTLLVMDPLNARTYLEQLARVLKRTRTWHIMGQADVEDYAEYRLLLPEEIQRMLETGGFEVLGMYDNREFQPTDLTGRITAGPDVGGMRGRKLYVFARKQ